MMTSIKTIHYSPILANTGEAGFFHFLSIFGFKFKSLFLKFISVRVLGNPKAVLHIAVDLQYWSL